jgi:hypothetical protein
MMDEGDARKPSPRRESLDGSGFAANIWSLSGIAPDRGDTGVDAMSLSCFNPQFFICSRVGDAALEDDDGAFSRRFPQEMHIIIDAIRALSAAVPLGHLLPGDHFALDRLQWLSGRMDQTGISDKKVATLSTAEVDDLIGRLQQLRRQDPESADRILRRLSEETALVPVQPE